MHKHHLIPRYMGGTNDSSNIIEVSVEAHAQIHKVRWEAFGHWQDKAAWLALSGMLGKEAIISYAASEGAKEVAKRRVADGTHHLLGPSNNNKRVANGTHPFLGGELQNERIAAGTHNFAKLAECPKCGKVGQEANMHRWHFDNCKN